MQELEPDAQQEIDESIEYWEFKNIKIETGAKPTQAFIKTYGDFFPRPLWYLWEQIGFACFDDGGFWLVNPDDYADLLDEILKPTPFYAHDDWYVLGRTAFGTLKVMGRQTKSSLTIYIDDMQIFPRILDNRQLTQRQHAIGLTVAAGVVEYKGEKSYDLTDIHHTPLFNRCLASYGKLKEDEIYTFVPAIALGGKQLLQNVQKVNIFEHINFITQLEPFEIMMDINRVVDNLGITPESAAAFVASQNSPPTTPPKYDETCIIQEGQPATVSGYYQDRMTKKVIYLNIGDVSPIYPTPSHLSKSQAYVWYKLTEHGISLIPEEILANAKK
ncbi:T6SS immunity protein Tdi1 domain-containing protein [Moraxella sp. K1664]|nr:MULTISPECIES: T6SS immunity protein Tdi1 domain-containing protein [Moraxella]MBE9578308.1 DUF1851 domain-containing protein [Moraxella sp. K1664]MDH9219883.1 DUF1851 domain-containing protein [Moraxella lacunata]MDI4482362.1 DUF1851 domain-containing protein [Moraxella lacunata]MDI4508542.1 DUF1851 domain-containing protein [Moraxella lacunata]